MKLKTGIIYKGPLKIRRLSKKGQEVKKMIEIVIGKRKIGIQYPPLVIPEIGINHEGDIKKAMQMVDDAFESGAECVKFQCHIVNDEMIYNDVIPANSDDSIWKIMNRCALNEEED